MEESMNNMNITNDTNHIDDIMQPEGWQRSNAQPFGRQRYVLTYRALVSEKYHTYKE